MNEDARLLMVTIQCITYNHEPYIRQCLEGFVMQKTNFRFEVVIHDDASTDGTAAIVREFAEKYPDIIKPIFETENQWSKHDGSLRQIMDEHTHGKYVAVCEGDDYWIDPKKLQKQVDFMEKNLKCSMVFHNAYYEDAITKYRRGIHKIYKTSRYADMMHIMRDGGFIPTCSIMYRRESFLKYNEFPKGCPAGDLPLQIYAKLMGDVYYINETMSVYRLVSTSVTHTAAKNSQKFVDRQYKFIDWYKNLNSYTYYTYKKEIENSIAFAEARVIIAQKDYFKLWNPKFWPYIVNKPWKVRIGIILAMCGLGRLSIFCQGLLYRTHGKTK